MKSFLANGKQTQGAATGYPADSLAEARMSRARKRSKEDRQSTNAGAELRLESSTRYWPALQRTDIPPASPSSCRCLWRPHGKRGRSARFQMLRRRGDGGSADERIC